MGNITSDIKTLKSDVTTLEEDYNTLSSNYNTLKKQVSDYDTLKKQVSESSSNYDTLSSNYNTLKNQVADSSSNAGKSIDYEDLAKKITAIGANNDKIAEAILKIPGTLGEKVAEKIGTNKSVTDRIVTGLEDNMTFAKTISDKLTDETGLFRDRLKGEKGAPGELASSKEAVKKALYDSKYTMWCADGDICQVPAGNKGIKIGDDTIFSHKEDWVRLLSDANNTDSYKRGFAARELWAKDNLVVRSRNILDELDQLRAGLNNKRDKNSTEERIGIWTLKGGNDFEIQRDKKGDREYTPYKFSQDVSGNWVVKSGDSNKSV